MTDPFKDLGKNLTAMVRTAATSAVSEGAALPPHPDTSPYPQRRTPRYPPPMHDALHDHNHPTAPRARTNWFVNRVACVHAQGRFATLQGGLVLKNANLARQWVS